MIKAEESDESSCDSRLGGEENRYRERDRDCAQWGNFFFLSRLRSELSAMAKNDGVSPQNSCTELDSQEMYLNRLLLFKMFK